MLTNHSTCHGHDPMERQAIADDLQQNISRITGDSNGKGKLSITSFIAGNTGLRQGLEGPPMTPSMWLERDYTAVYFKSTIQPTLKVRPPFSHRPHKELKGWTEKPREKKITQGDQTAPINRLESHPKTSRRRKGRNQRKR